VPGAHDHRRDRDLLERLASGSAEALADIYDRHAASLFRHALVLVRDRADAEDLVQAVFVKLATTGAPLLGVRQPAGYLHRMLHRAWIDEERRKATGARAVDFVTRDGAAWHANTSAGIEDSVDLLRALQRLPALQREVIVLHLIEGFSFREIGRLTNVSLFTAAGRYRVGMNRLRAALQADARGER
jgi:RNA polymerase sigma-70 factor (ECF subfamily)